MRWLILLCLATPAGADTVVAARTIRALSVLSAADVAVVAGATPGALADPAAAIGLEARTVLYAGRPIRPADLVPPAVVERNQIVPVAFAAGALSIRAEGRALDRGGVGATVRVMNLASRTIVTGRVRADGSVAVGPHATP